MSCPLCGDDCRCAHPRPRSRFRPTGSRAQNFDPALSSADSSGLLDPEACDNSEEQFAASLESDSNPAKPRFIPDPPGGRRPHTVTAGSCDSEMLPAPQGPAAEVAGSGASEAAAAAVAEALDAASEGFAIQLTDEEDNIVEPLMTGEAEAETGTAAEPFASDSNFQVADEESLSGEPQWRQEVAARVHNYHSRRRRRPPRYPSLALKFDPPAYSWSGAERSSEPPRAAGAYQSAPSRCEAATAATLAPEPAVETQPVPETNIIEFPRPLLPPPPRPDELAEPILDKPRILDAPETVPKQVPLGGIILEPEESVVASGLELPLQVATLSRRITASVIDGALVFGAAAIFAFLADKIGPLRATGSTLLWLGMLLPAALWGTFQYVFLVYTGTTPGLSLLRLRLSNFDGGPPDRSTRRWRALAMALSALSLGLGFLWCLLDEDTLCWHDRITRTYLNGGPAVAAANNSGPVFPHQAFAWLARIEGFLRRRADESVQDEAAPWQG